jgi:hypothetical protein
MLGNRLKVLVRLQSEGELVYQLKDLTVFQSVQMLV